MKKSIILIGIAILVVAATVIFMLARNPGNKTGSVDFGSYDQALVERLVSDYDMTYHGAKFLALTKFEATSLKDNAYQIDASFPTGNKARLTVRVFPGSSYTPVSSETVYGGNGSPRIFGLTLNHRETAKEFSFRLEYFVPYDDLPQETVDQLGALIAATPGQSFLQRLFSIGVARAQESGGINGVNVVAEGAVDMATDYVVGEAVEQAFGEVVSTFISSVTGVSDAWEARQDHLKWQSELDALKKCAENPANPLTKKMYDEDPSSKDKIVSEINRTQVELKVNSAVRFISIMGTVAASPLPGLGTVVGKVMEWTSQAASEANDQLIREAEKMVTTDGNTQSTEAPIGPDGEIHWEMVRCSPKKDEPPGAPRPPGWYGFIDYEYRIVETTGEMTFKVKISLKGDTGSWSAILGGYWEDEETQTTMTGSGGGGVLIGAIGYGQTESNVLIIMHYGSSDDRYMISFATPPVIRNYRVVSKGRKPGGSYELSMPLSGGAQGTIGGNPDFLSGSEQDTDGETTIKITWSLNRS